MSCAYRTSSVIIYISFCKCTSVSYSYDGRTLVSTTDAWHDQLKCYDNTVISYDVLNASVGLGISGTAEIISGTVGIQFGDVVSIQAKGYVGAGITFDFTNGIKFGIGY